MSAKSRSSSRVGSAKKISLSPESKRVSKQIQNIVVRLEPSQEWNKRVQALECLPDIITTITSLSSSAQDECNPALIKLASALAKQLVDLRSEVTGCAFETLINLCEQLNFNRPFRTIVPQLLEQVGSTNSVIRNQARQSVSRCMGYVLNICIYTYNP